MNPSTGTVLELERPSQTLRLRPWSILLIVGSIALLYYSVVWRLLLDWWTDPNFSHGFLVPLFSAFLVWQNRDALKRIPLKPSWWGLPIVLASLCGLFLGVFGSELFISRTSLIFLLAGIIVFLLGWAHFRSLLFAWFVLFLGVPMPSIIFNQITFPLQILASKLAANLLPLAGVPVLREGNVIQLPAMLLEVADACSGIRSLVSLTTLAIMYGHFLEKGIISRVLLALAAIPIAVVANASRIVGTGLTVQYWDPDKALGFFHEFSGWVVFIVSFGLLLLFHSAIRYALHLFARKKP